jgi:hypothetical protein
MIKTNPVFVQSVGANPIMEIVRELRAKHLVQGIDFDFSYQQVQQHYSDGFDLIRNGATFYFKDDKWATFFRLQYGNGTQTTG